MPYDNDLALKLGSRVQDAYALYYGAADPQGAPGVVPDPATSTPFYADDLTDGTPDYKVFGFIDASAPADLIIAIRGTEGILEWFDDFHFGRVICPFVPGSGDIEEGFSNFYETFSMGQAPGSISVASYLEEMVKGGGVNSITIAGHSLGSSLATLLAVDLGYRLSGENAGVAIMLYTFASPYVGDSDFAARFNALVPDSWRIANELDVAPKVPGPLFGYTQVNTPYLINSLGVTKLTFGCWHSMQTYLHLLDPTNSLGARSQLSADCM